MKYSIIFPDATCESVISVALHVCDNGAKFTSKSLEQLVIFLDNDYVSRCNIYSKDAFNVSEVCDIARTIRAIFGKEKEICVYTNTLTLNEILSNNELHDYVDKFINVDL